jgi:hypothetical protein
MMLQAGLHGDFGFVQRDDQEGYNYVIARFWVGRVDTRFDGRVRILKSVPVRAWKLMVNSTENGLSIIGNRFTSMALGLEKHYDTFKSRMLDALMFVHDTNAALMRIDRVSSRVAEHRECSSLTAVGWWVVSISTIVAVVAAAIDLVITIMLRRMPNWYTDITGYAALPRRWHAAEGQSCEKLWGSNLPARFVNIEDVGDGIGRLSTTSLIRPGIPLAQISSLGGKAGLQ